MEHFWIYLSRFDLLLTGALLYIAVCRSIGANLCYTYALGKIPVATATLSTNAIPLISTLFACWLLNESLHMVHFIAALLILTGATMAIKGQQNGRGAIIPQPALKTAIPQDSAG